MTQEYKVFDNGGELKLFTVPVEGKPRQTKTPFAYGVKAPKGEIIAWTSDIEDAQAIVLSMNAVGAVRDALSTDLDDAPIQFNEGETTLVDTFDAMLDAAIKPVPALPAPKAANPKTNPANKFHRSLYYKNGAFSFNMNTLEKEGASVPTSSTPSIYEGWHKFIPGFCGSPQSAYPDKNKVFDEFAYGGEMHYRACMPCSHTLTTRVDGPAIAKLGLVKDQPLAEKNAMCDAGTCSICDAQRKGQIQSAQLAKPAVAVKQHRSIYVYNGNLISFGADSDANGWHDMTSKCDLQGPRGAKVVSETRVIYR